MGTMMGRLPCSLVPGMEVDGVVEGSVTPFLDAGKDWELLALSGEPSRLSVEAGIFGNKFSRQEKLREIKHCWTTGQMLRRSLNATSRGPIGCLKFNSHLHPRHKW